MIQVSGPLIWNDIPDDIQKAGTIFTFKKQMKQHIFDQYAGESNRPSGISNTNHISIPHSNFGQRWRQNINQPFVSRWNPVPGQ